LHNNNYETSTKQKSEILMEIYTVAIYDRRTCMKKDNPGWNCFSRKTISSVARGILL